MRRVGSSSVVRLLGGWRAAGGKAPAYRQLYEALRLLVLDGRLPLAVRLPGERELAGALGVSRTTVAAAYAELRDLGYLSSRHGSGSVTRLPTGPGSRPPAQIDGDGASIEFSVAALPATQVVHRAYVDALSALPRHLPGTGYEAFGLPELREAIAERYCRRGVPTGPEHIFITQGAQHGMTLMLRILASPGDRIVVDHPTYPLAIDAVQRASCRVVPVQLPDSGWDVDALEAAFRQAGPRMAYLLPDFHNPTGRCMDEATRIEIAALAARTRTMLVVDETMADLWLDAPPPPPLAAYDQGGFVVTLGSTGKTFWGGLRVGWVRADAQIVASLARSRASMDLGTPILEQLAVAALLQNPEDGLDIRRAELRRQRDHLLRLVADLLPDWRVHSPPGGLSVWAELPAPVSTVLASAADVQRVRIAPGTRFGVDGAFERFVRLPFALPEEDLTRAVQRLAAAWHSLSSGRSPTNAQIEARAVADEVI